MAKETNLCAGARWRWWDWKKEGEVAWEDGERRLKEKMKWIEKNLGELREWLVKWEKGKLWKREKEKSEN